MTLRNPALDNLLQAGFGGTTNQFGQDNLPKFYNNPYQTQRLFEPTTPVPEVPSAIEKSSPLEHFWYGLSSPVTGTLGKLGAQGHLGDFGSKHIAPWHTERNAPQTTGENVASMAGSILGWGGLLSLGLIAKPLAIAGSGVAMALKGVGMGAKVAGMVGKGAATGAAMGAHHAWLEDKPISNEVLQSMAFGAAFGLAGHGAGRAMQKLGWTMPESRDAIMRDLGRKMVNFKDPNTDVVGATLSKRFATASTRNIMGSAKPVATGSIDDLIRPFKSAPAQKGWIEKLYKSKDLGGQHDALTGLGSSLRKAQQSLFKKHGVTSLEELGQKSPKAYRTYLDRQNTINHLKGEVESQVRGVLRGNIELPPTHTISFDQGNKKMVPLFREYIDSSRGGVVKDLNMWHPRIQELFNNWNAKTGRSISHASRKSWPAEFAKQFDDVADALVKAGDTPRVLLWGQQAVPVPHNIFGTKSIQKWASDLRNVPEIKGSPIVSVYDALKIQGYSSPLNNMLRPTRGVLSEPLYNAFRTKAAVQQRQADKWGSGFIKQSLEFVGAKTDKAASQVGHRLTPVLQGNFKSTTYNDKAREIAGRLVGMEKAPTGRAVTQIAKDLKMPASSVRRAFDSMKKDFADKDIDSVLKGLRVDKQDYASAYLKREFLRHHGKNPTEEIAKMIGLNSSKELQLAGNFQKHYEKLFKMSGLSPERMQVLYSPAIMKYDGRDAKAIMRTFKAVGDNKHTDAIFWAHGLEKKGRLVEAESDAFRVMGRYVAGLTKKRNFEPLFDDANKFFETAGIHPTRAAVWENLKAHMKGVPTQTEVTMDRMLYNFADAIGKSHWNAKWGPKPTAQLSSFLAELQILGGLGANPFTAAKNLTQRGLGFSSIANDGNPLVGVQYFGKAMAMKNTKYGKYLRSLNPIKDNRQFHESFIANEGAVENILRKMGASSGFTKGTKAVKDKLMAMFKISDMSNVEDTFLAKLLYEMDRGTNFATALNSATKTTASTQFLYGFDSPMLYKSGGPLGPLGRQLGIFMSWPLNWAHMMIEQGSKGEAQRALSTIITMAAGAEILNLTGYSFNSIHPVNTARGILPIALAEGEERWPMALRSAAVVSDGLKALGRGDYDAVDMAMENFKRRMWLLVPGGIMGQRAYSVIDLAQNEWRKTNHRDRLMYETTPGEAFRSMFGPTMENHYRFEDWQKVSQMDNYYRRMRREAVDAFFEGDIENFQYLQEQLVINFGRFIEQKDIEYEVKLRGMTARERQMTSMPASLRDPYLDLMSDRDRIGIY